MLSYADFQKDRRRAMASLIAFEEQQLRRGEFGALEGSILDVVLGRQGSLNLPTPPPTAPLSSATAPSTCIHNHSTALPSSASAVLPLQREGNVSDGRLHDEDAAARTCADHTSRDSPSRSRPMSVDSSSSSSSQHHRSDHRQLLPPALQPLQEIDRPSTVVHDAHRQRPIKHVVVRDTDEAAAPRLQEETTPTAARRRRRTRDPTVGNSSSRDINERSVALSQTLRGPWMFFRPTPFSPYHQHQDYNDDHNHGSDGGGSGGGSGGQKDVNRAILAALVEAHCVPLLEVDVSRRCHHHHSHSHHSFLHSRQAGTARIALPSSTDRRLAHTPLAMTTCAAAAVPITKRGPSEEGSISAWPEGCDCSGGGTRPTTTPASRRPNHTTDTPPHSRAPPHDNAGIGGDDDDVSFTVDAPPRPRTQGSPVVGLRPATAVLAPIRSPPPSAASTGTRGQQSAKQPGGRAAGNAPTKEGGSHGLPESESTNASAESHRPLTLHAGLLHAHADRQARRSRKGSAALQRMAHYRALLRSPAQTATPARSRDKDVPKMQTAKDALNTGANNTNPETLSLKGIDGGGRSTAVEEGVPHPPQPSSGPAPHPSPSPSQSRSLRLSRGIEEEDNTSIVMRYVLRRARDLMQNENAGLDVS